MKLAESKNALNLTRLAAVLTQRCNVPVSKVSIKHWQKRNPPFPMPVEQGRYDVEECVTWMREHYLPKAGKAENRSQIELLAQSEEAVARSKITKAEHDQFELDVAQGKYIERKSAEHSIKSAMNHFFAFVRAEVESGQTSARYDKLKELNAEPDLLAAFHEFDLKQAQTIIDRIAAACARASE